ncbi:MAG: response regulator transcription factor [Verrucomicrobiota bacterium JB022]|nr:response regulator transcription factor [Verrucomicrobiota bacterium JB022]
MSIRIGIVDNHPVVLLGLRTLLEEQAHFVIAWTADSADQALEWLAERPVDIVVVDLRMPEVSGLDLLRQIQSRAPQCRRVVLSAYAYPQEVKEAYRLGINAYFTKDDPIEDVVDGLQRVAGGDVVIKAEHQSFIEDDFRNPLSPREREILHLLAKGYSNKMIASELTLTQGTVKAHVIRLFQKLNVHSRTEAIKKGLKEGYFSVDDLG